MWRFESGTKSPGLMTSTNNNVGRQVWVYDENATPAEKEEVERLQRQFSENKRKHGQKHAADELLRMQSAHKLQRPMEYYGQQAMDETQTKYENVLKGQQAQFSVEDVDDHLHAAISYFGMLQQEDGHWPGDYGGPLFLHPGMAIACYTCRVFDKVFTPPAVAECVRYLRNHQNDDGGYGLHIEGHSTMFGTALNYVFLRLLGIEKSDAVCVKARKWIQQNKGATHCTSWGKFWLAVLGVYSWEGMNPLTPEMWLLPYSKYTGIGYLHPGRFWCHCRMVYLPMSYVYGIRGTCDETQLVRELRNELYPEPYQSVDWAAARFQCAPQDLYYPHPWIQDVLWWAMYKLEFFLHGSWLRKMALRECMELIHYEDENTRYVDIGPVNKVINMLACWFDNPKSEAFQRHIPRLADYIWVAEDGMKMNGYNGVQLWDTAFTVQAIFHTGLAERYPALMKKANSFVEKTQVIQDCPGDLVRYQRHISKGAWPFSTRDHGWPISDCTSEGLKAVLCLSHISHDLVGPHLPLERVRWAVDLIMSYQNWDDGGFGTYELRRSSSMLEIINPSETFGDIIVEYSYIELTSTAVQALAQCYNRYPGYKEGQIKSAVRRGLRFIKNIQRKDGSWYGCWGVCFTYAAWAGLVGYAHAGLTYENSQVSRKGVDFLLSKQREDGGWGESYKSSQDKVYTQKEGESHMANTAWAVIALLAAGYHKADPQPIHRAAAFLMAMQKSNGDFPQQSIVGVFNGNCMIKYINYKNSFTIWALGLYKRMVLEGASFNQIYYQTERPRIPI